MTNQQPIKLPSILDNDLYKFTMQQGAFELFAERNARYRFINRGKQKFTPTMIERLRASVDGMRQLKLNADERQFMEAQGIFRKEYLDFLEDYRYKPEQVKIDLTQDGQLEMIIDGPWKESILWEVPLMALVSEVALDETAPLTEADRYSFVLRTVEKAQRINNERLSVSEFGTRRRRDFATQETAVGLLKSHAGDTFAGTSNVYLAMIHHVPAVGTMAHEWVMAHAAIFGVENANRKALQSWRKIYPNALKIFLPDTYTSDLAFANLGPDDFQALDGFRWDSGNAKVFTSKLLSCYADAEVDAREKKIVYSDSLTIDDAVELKKSTKGKIKAAFGIGTHLTNDFLTPALKIVIKMEALDGKAVVKISDNLEKASGDPAAVAEVLEVIARVQKYIGLNALQKAVEERKDAKYEVA